MYLITVKNEDKFKVIEKVESYSEALYNVEQYTLLDELRLESFGYWKLQTYVIIKDDDNWRQIYQIV